METKASKILESGPAREVKTIPVFILTLSKFLGLTGTGFAQPKPKKNKQIAPIGSMWFLGLKESLPEFLAVSSPKRYATNPCATS